MSTDRALASVTQEALQTSSTAQSVVGDQAREAVSALRGYAYQVYAAALAWLDLADDGELHLEVAEDFASVAREALRATQVKDTSGTVSLASEAVRDAIGAYVGLVEANPGRTVRFVFLTTATITQERKREHRTGDVPGLEFWQRVAHGSDMAPLRRVLEALDLGAKAKAFIRARNDERLRDELVRRIEWRCGASDIAGLAERLRERVADYAFQHLKVPTAEGRRLADTVFIKVLETSVISDRKKRVLRTGRLKEVLDTASRVSVPRAAVETMLARYTPEASGDGSATAAISQSDALADAVAERVLSRLGLPAALAPGRAVLDGGPSVEALDELRRVISDQVGHRLDHLLSGFRSGRVADTATALAAIRDGAEWKALDNSTKARVLRLQASTRLHADDEAGASALADAADMLHPPSEPRLRALLAYHREGPAAALRIFGEPTSQEGAHLKAALLLEAGDIPTGLRLLDEHPAVEAGHAEALRLRALGALLSGDREQGLMHAEAAIAAQPAWPSVQWAAAMARYACALSPVVPPDRFLAPNPVPLDLVKEDERSRQLLLKALQAFEALSTDAEATAAERRDSAVFALACLCNLRERSADAAARVEEMLRDDPAWAAVANWALARGFPIDVAALRAALQEKLESGGGKAEHVLLLAMALDTEGRTAEAAAAVERWASAFGTSEGDRAFHEAWLARFRRRAGGPGTAVLADSTVDVGDLEDLLAAAKASGDWSVLEGLFERMASESSPPPMTILPVAQVLAASGRWAALGRHTDTLTAVGTPDPIRIAAYALLNTGRAQATLDLLRDRRPAFPGSKLPGDLTRIEVEALSRAGNQAAAIRKAVSLASTDGAGAQDALAAAAAHLRVGNVQGALPYVRAAEAHGDLQPREALSLAHAVAAADPVIATRLWHRVLAGGAEPKLVPAALTLAFRLNLEREAAPLMGMLGDLSSMPDSGVSAIGIDEIREFMRERHEAAEQISRMHLRAELPVHLAAEHAGANLAELYHLGDTSRSGRGNYPIMMMHGLRSTAGAEPWKPGDGPVHMDVTAVLVADQLGLFDALEAMKGQVFLPPSLPAALLDMEQRLRHRQPRRMDAMRQVLALAASGGIARSQAAWDPGQPGPGTTQSETWMVDFTREMGGEHDGDSADVPARSLANPRGVVDVLLTLGEIDPVGHLAAIEELGGEGGAAPVGSPSRGDHLALTQQVAVELAQAEVLARVADTFKASMPAQDLDWLAAEVAHAEGRAAKADRIAALRGRIALALGDGTFLTLPESEQEGGEERLGLASRCLVELLRAVGAAGGVTWIDDRLANGFATCGANRIVSTPDMLDALAVAGRISA